MNVWTSKVTKSMVKHLTDDEISQLADALDKAVMQVCESYEIS